MKCIECKNCDLQKSKEMSKLGFGFCKMTVATFYSLHKSIDCAGYRQADDKIIEKRLEWFTSKKHYPQGMKIEDC